MLSGALLGNFLPEIGQKVARNASVHRPGSCVGRSGDDGRMALTPLQLLDTDSLISEEDRAIRDTVRTLVDDKLRPEIAGWYDAGSAPVRELAKEFGSLGLLGMHLTGYGCAGTSATAYGLACLELEAGDSGLRSVVSVQGSLAMYSIWKHGSDAQKDEWLPRMATGEAIGCFGLTEPDFGSNPGGMRTRARQDGTDWVLTGNKMWITNGSVADVAVVWARVVDSGADDGIRGFVVPTDTDGFAAPDIKQKMSLRASVTSELVLDDVRLPAEAMLPGAQGLSGPLSCLTEARFGIVFGALGAARDCLETTIAYAKDREIFDRSLASYQLTQAKLADMSVELGKGMLLALHLGRLKDEGGLPAEAVSVGKLNNTREALRIARECRTILGAAGITLEYPLMRHANNLESVLTYEGTAEVHQLVIGQALTGESAFR
jgi:glutaryl-CoA dehydrogenase